MTATILVVEDNPQNFKLTKVILQAAGHRVIGAVTASEAEATIAHQVPDLILMDIALPGKDGYTFTRELRSRPETQRLPILAVSSFAMPGDAERALAAGCTAYLTKPIRRALLLERVDKLLGSRASSDLGRTDRSDGDPAREPPASVPHEVGSGPAPPEGVL